MADENELRAAPSPGLSGDGTGREEDGLRPAGFWARGGAVVVDGFIVLSGVAVVGGLLALLGVPSVLLQVFGILAPFVYNGLCIGRWGRTPGKRLAGLAVVGADGRTVGYARAFARAFATLLSTLIVFIGYLLALWTPGRSLHDRLAGTRVVRLPEVPAWRGHLASGLGVVSVAVFVLVLAYPGNRGADLSFEERASATNLQTLRIALLRRATDMGERGREPYPDALTELVPDVLTEMPPLAIGGHPETRLTESYGAELCRDGDAGPVVDAARLRDTGRWGWIRGGAGACQALVFMDCTHKDDAGRLWSSY
ncbi:MAG: RDD family protein [Elusimicrobiota bacterium]|jgi:uncharacterized RDD family membrane protein YckC